MQDGGERHVSGPEAFADAFAVSRETLEKLETYAALLARWQTTINLVAPATLPDLWHRHFADSAQLFALAQGHAECRSGRWLDVGSGAGFPGLVLAIMAAEEGLSRHTLIESDSRKAAFLSEVARKTGVAVEIVAARIESRETIARVGKVQCVTARALAPLPRLLPLVAPFFEASTIGLFLKGREVAAELDEAKRSLAFACELIPSMTESDSRIVKISALNVPQAG